MLQELLVNDQQLPQLFPYEEKPITSAQVRVAVHFGAPKHGTEMNVFRNNPFESVYYDEDQHIFLDRAEKNSVVNWGLGNIWIGEIIELGAEVKDFKIGDQVAGYGSLRSTHVKTADQLLKMPESMSWQAAVCYDPMQFALGGLRDAHMRIGDRVLVSGLGAIGMMAAQAAKAAGASFVAVSDPIEKRRTAALANGADVAFDPIQEDFGLKLRGMTQGQGVDVVIETSANYKAVEQGLRALGYMGNMALVGWFKEAKVPINFGREGHFNLQNVFFSRACSEPNRDYPRWNFQRICDEAWRLLSGGQIRCENIVAPVVDFQTCDLAYRHYIIDHPEESIKMGVRF